MSFKEKIKDFFAEAPYILYILFVFFLIGGFIAFNEYIHHKKESSLELDRNTQDKKQAGVILTGCLNRLHLENTTNFHLKVVQSIDSRNNFQVRYKEEKLYILKPAESRYIRKPKKEVMTFYIYRDENVLHTILQSTCIEK